MSKTYLIRLYFQNAMHIGAASPGIGLEGTDGMIIHSDTLWAALCNNWAIARKVGKVAFDDFLDAFVTGNPLFQISSGFPLTDKGYYWLPKPLSEPFPFTSDCQCQDDMRQDYGKAIKRKNLLRLDHFIGWLNFDDEIDLETAQDDITAGNAVDEVRPHNTLDRTSMAAQIYHSGSTYFDKGKAGVYFLLRTDDPDVAGVISDLLDIIKNSAGIGGNRSIGLGAIEHVDPMEEVDASWSFLNDNSGKNAYCTLSIYHPKPAENFVQGSVAYNLILRKGWTGSLSVGSQVKRQTVYMFAEGSVFTDEPQGHLVDLSPTQTPDNEPYPHPIWRYGYAFTVPIKIQQEKATHE